MAGGIFGFFIGAATAVLVLKVFRRSNFKPIKSADSKPFDPDNKLKGAMRAIEEISSVLSKLSASNQVVVSEVDGESLNLFQVCLQNFL